MGYPYPIAPALCRGCGSEFTPTDPRQADCTKGCGRFKRERQTNDWLLANRPHLPTEPCLNCGKPVVQYRKRRKPSDLRYCSTTCRPGAPMRATWPPILAGRSSSIATRCIECDKRIAKGQRCSPHASARSNALQKLRTRIRWLLPKKCMRCGEEFNRFDSGWHCESCKKANLRQTRALRKARKRGAGSYEPGIHHESVYDKSDGTCALCGGRVADPSVWWDWDGQTWMPLAPTVDHIVPLARNGTHTWSNVQLAHNRCNALKGDR